MSDIDWQDKAQRWMALYERESAEYTRVALENARLTALLAERDALAARLAAAEAALWAVGVPLINNVMCWCQESRDMAYGHSDACRQANAALAGSRRQAGEGA